MLTSNAIDAIAAVTVECAFKVHRQLGPGLLESIYQRCLAHKLKKCGVGQLLTYLKLTGLRLGFLINWNVPLLKDGLKRLANNF